MAAAEEAFNINTTLQTDIEQAQLDVFQEGVRTEFGSLSSFLVAAETGAESPLRTRVGVVADNIAAGLEAVGERAHAVKEAVTPRKAVAALSAASMALGAAFAPNVLAEGIKIYSGNSKIAAAKIRRMQEASKVSLAVGGRSTDTDGHGDKLTQKVVTIDGEKRMKYTLHLKKFKTIVGGRALVNTVDGRKYFPGMHYSTKTHDYTYTSQEGGTPPSKVFGVYLK